MFYINLIVKICQPKKDVPLQKFEQLEARLSRGYPLYEPHILVCAGTGCVARVSLAVAASLEGERLALLETYPWREGLVKVRREHTAPEEAQVCSRYSHEFYKEKSEALK